MNPLDKIQSYYDTYTKTDREIAIFIINHPHDIAAEAIDIIAKKTKSSKSALVRFAKKIGYQGYAEFRFELSRFLVGRNNELEDINNQTSPIESIAEAYSKYILELKNYVSYPQTQRIAQFIKKANRIKIIGINRTYQSARQLKQRLSRLGYDSESIFDTVDLRDDSDMATENDLFIFFTVRNNGKYDSFIRELAQKKAKIVVISVSDKLPYQSFCDEFVILPRIDKENNMSFLDNQPIFMIYDEILLNVLAQMGNEE